MSAGCSKEVGDEEGKKKGRGTDRLANLSKGEPRDASFVDGRSSSLQVDRNRSIVDRQSVRNDCNTRK